MSNKNAFLELHENNPFCFYYSKGGYLFIRKASERGYLSSVIIGPENETTLV